MKISYNYETMFIDPKDASPIWHIRKFANTKVDIGKGFTKRVPVTKEWLEEVALRSDCVEVLRYQLEQSVPDDVWTEHWQITAIFTKPVNSYQVKGIFRMKPGEYRAPCESLAASERYCQKMNTRKDGPFEWHRPSILNALKNIV